MCDSDALYHAERAAREAQRSFARADRYYRAARRARRRERLILVLTCLGIFAFAMLCAWGGGLL